MVVKLAHKYAAMLRMGLRPQPQRPRWIAAPWRKSASISWPTKRTIPRPNWQIAKRSSCNRRRGGPSKGRPPLRRQPHRRRVCCKRRGSPLTAADMASLREAGSPWRCGSQALDRPPSRTVPPVSHQARPSERAPRSTRRPFRNTDQASLPSRSRFRVALNSAPKIIAKATRYKKKIAVTALASPA
jgi:hypothetical protein